MIKKATPRLFFHYITTIISSNSIVIEEGDAEWLINKKVDYNGIDKGPGGFPLVIKKATPHPFSTVASSGAQ